MALCLIFMILLSLENVKKYSHVVVRLPQRHTSTLFEIFSTLWVPFEHPPFEKNSNNVILPFEANSALSCEMRHKLWKLYIVQNICVFGYKNWEIVNLAMTSFFKYSIVNREFHMFLVDFKELLRVFEYLVWILIVQFHYSAVNVSASSRYITILGSHTSIDSKREVWTARKHFWTNFRTIGGPLVLWFQFLSMTFSLNFYPRKRCILYVLWDLE